MVFRCFRTQISFAICFLSTCICPETIRPEIKPPHSDANSNGLMVGCQELRFFELTNANFTQVLSRLNIEPGTIRYISSLRVTSVELFEMSYSQLRSIGLSSNDIWRISQCVSISQQIESHVLSLSTNKPLSEKNLCECKKNPDLELSLISLLHECSGDYENTAVLCPRQVTLSVDRPLVWCCDIWR